MGKRLTAIIIVLIVAAGSIFGCNSKEPTELTDVPQAEITPPEVESPNVPRRDTATVNISVDSNTVSQKSVETELVKAKLVDTDAVETKIVEAEPVRLKSGVSFHNNCAGILSTYVDDNGRVNYKKLKLKREKLRKVLGTFALLDPNEYGSWPVKDKIAFWINAYNLFTLKIVIDHYPIKPSRFRTIRYPAKSIMQIPKVWTKNAVTVMGVKYSLREIERNILLREFDDVRVCFALSYASTSSPALRNEPYTGSGLDRQLDEQVKAFLSSPYGFKIDRKKPRVYLSAIFKEWYAGSFISKYGTDSKFPDKKPVVRAALNFISNYVSRKDADFLARKDYSVEFITYNWTLNE